MDKMLLHMFLNNWEFVFYKNKNRDVLGGLKCFFIYQ